MKVSFLFIFLLLSSIVNAAEVVVMEADLPGYNYASTYGDARFHIDFKTGEGFVKASATEVRYEPMPGRWCQPGPYGRCIPGQHYPSQQQYTIFSSTKKVEGLMLMGSDLVYHGAEGNFVCGTVKPSRVFKVPTLYLSGACVLDTAIVNNRTNKKIVVKLITK